jgi:quercetin dioxygenase-like cupin family protein
VLDVVLDPGGAHDFHRHPRQEQLVIVVSGWVEQWVGTERQEMNSGDSVFSGPDVVHATFNLGTEAAKLQLILGPAVGDTGYEFVDVAAEEPWRSLRRA